MNKKLFYVVLAIISGLLLAASWPARGIAPLIFVAFIPLFYITDQLLKKNKPALRAWPFLYLAFVIWNLLTTYWIWYASKEGAIVAIFLNSYIMSLVWMFFIRAKKTFGSFRGYLALILFWIGYEYLHLDWDLSWPWLLIGNVFANQPNIIQWYEITGTMGGTLWVLLVNIFIYETIKEFRNRKAYFRSAFITSLLLLVPAIISILRYNTYEETQDPIEVVCVQPNIDPWGKFGSITPEYQLNHLIELAASEVDENTHYVIFPETAIPNPLDQDSLHRYVAVDRIEEFIAAYPQLKLIKGATLIRFFPPGVPVASTASSLKYPPGAHWDDYNAAIQFGNNDPYQFYYKSKLVPGPEMFPFAEVLKPLQHKLFGKLGGQIGDLGTQKERSVF